MSLRLLRMRAKSSPPTEMKPRQGVAGNHVAFRDALIVRSRVARQGIAINDEDCDLMSGILHIAYKLLINDRAKYAPGWHHFCRFFDDRNDIAVCRHPVSLVRHCH